MCIPSDAIGLLGWSMVISLASWLSSHPLRAPISESEDSSDDRRSMGPSDGLASSWLINSNPVDYLITTCPTYNVTTGDLEKETKKVNN